jgi:predicted unusual protein kinase regulating ubiquinone biosynthesis (AarF/ABC1/UbiB family)
MSAKNIYSRSFRLRKAYWTTAVVMFSYARLQLLKKIFGQMWYEERILPLHIRNAERVRDAILELKGLFIKLGQILSTLSNFIPEAFQKPLEALQDKIPQRPFTSVRTRILQEFGKPIEELFADFDENAIAAASIGQAHRARLHDGTEVVVKVQHVDIEVVAAVDLHIIQRLTRFAAWFYDIKGMDYIYTQVRKMIEEELDFTQEAASMQIIRANLAEEVGITIPIVHPAFSTKKVMTTTWHDGVKIANTEQLDTWQINRRALASCLLRAYCRMLFKDGFYHADPHPGNILVQKDGMIVLLDFGAVAYLSSNIREGIPKLIEAAILNDSNATIAALHAMGFIAQSRDAEKIAEKILSAVRNFLENEVNFEGLNFKDIDIDPFNNSLAALIKEIGLSGIASTVQVPKDYVLLSRMMTLLLGTCNMLDPQLNPLDIVRPYAEKYLLGKNENPFSLAAGFLRRTATSVLSLPDELRQTLQKAKKGELEIHNPDIKDGVKLLYSVGQQLIFALLLIATAAFAYLFHKEGEEKYVRMACWAAGCWGFMLFLEMRKGRKYK